MYHAERTRRSPDPSSQCQILLLSARSTQKTHSLGQTDELLSLLDLHSPLSPCQTVKKVSRQVSAKLSFPNRDTEEPHSLPPDLLSALSPFRLNLFRADPRHRRPNQQRPDLPGARPRRDPSSIQNNLAIHDHGRCQCPIVPLARTA